MHLECQKANILRLCQCQSEVCQRNDVLAVVRILDVKLGRQCDYSYSPVFYHQHHLS